MKNYSCYFRVVLKLRAQREICHFFYVTILNPSRIRTFPCVTRIVSQIYHTFNIMKRVKEHELEETRVLCVYVLAFFCGF